MNKVFTTIYFINFLNYLPVMSSISSSYTPSLATSYSNYSQDNPPEHQSVASISLDFSSRYLSQSDPCTPNEASDPFIGQNASIFQGVNNPWNPLSFLPEDVQAAHILVNFANEANILSNEPQKQSI